VSAKEVVVLDDAADDLERGKDFYESREIGVGHYFLDSLISDISSLRLYAGIHESCFGFLRMLSKRFPFGIYYYMEFDFAIVVAILDMRMCPGTICELLSARSIPAVPKKLPQHH
jgi:hypothetical protein